MLQLLTAFYGSFGVLGTVFWIWMIYDCVQNERDRQTWLWLLIFLSVIGAFLYFITRWLPRANFVAPPMFNRWTMRNALWQAEADAKNIGKAHQYIKLGKILEEMGDRPKAVEAYQQALTREPENPQALWGAALLALRGKDLPIARSHLQTLIKIKPDFMYGDASLYYGQVLFDLEDFDAANAHLTQHLRFWTQPEAYLMLAKIQQRQGDRQAAKETLETMIIKIKSSSPFQYRKNQKYVRQGERMLKSGLR